MALTNKNRILKRLNADLLQVRDNYFKKTGFYKGWKSSDSAKYILGKKEKFVESDKKYKAQLAEQKQKYFEEKGYLTGWKSTKESKKILANEKRSKTLQDRNYDLTVAEKPEISEEVERLASAAIFYSVLSYGSGKLMKAVEGAFTLLEMLKIKEVKVKLVNYETGSEFLCMDRKSFDFNMREFYFELIELQEEMSSKNGVESDSAFAPLIDTYQLTQPENIFILVYGYLPENPPPDIYKQSL